MQTAYQKALIPTEAMKQSSKNDFNKVQHCGKLPHRDKDRI